ncbi:hypothetical protein CONLIGDRAFT_629334 [Coniochaeta ligniaria NRRL 30616]|uniref:Uncharacterized protein n=1 Tax=Coniochaeta ligniaria NRRL 30616 TaxID=1408157 RepID=A0A1J7IVE2_9PEZI|nr:hypothetical protein CONLIGDRAFT_629334 [Coniochaeta ligniaria NRRL 30616]
MLENAGPIGNGYYLPTYDSFQSLINVYKTFRELVREDFQKTHGAPRLISAEVTVFFGKMILKKATDLLVGKHSTLEVPMTLVVERFLRMVEAHLLLWMRQAAGELRDVVDKAKEAVVGAHMDEAKRRILEHQQTYLEAAGAFEAQRIVLARSVMDLRAMRAASS